MHSGQAKWLYMLYQQEERTVASRTLRLTLFSPLFGAANLFS